MRRCRRTLLVLVSAWTALVPAAFAQLPPVPRIGYVYPAGGRQGDEFDLTIGGKNLDGVSEAMVSGGGVQSMLIGHFRPKMPATASLAEIVTFHIKIAADTEPSQREFRLQTAGGLTNPLAFSVGRLPEFREKAKGNDTPGETAITLPSIVNGRILPGEVDRYRFQVRKGKRLVFAASARELVPYLPDAVPGWFQATLALYDAGGNRLAYADDYRFNPDPVLDYEVPKDGEYVIEICDAIYRGREDFVYRIAAGELPFVTSVFPLGGTAGRPTEVNVKGWNLPADRLTPAFASPGVQWLYLSKRDASLSARSVDLLLTPESTRSSDLLASTELISNRVAFAVDTLPETPDQEPNNSRETAQAVTLPVIVNGRIGHPGDWDVFRFQGRAGQRILAEVHARRLGSPLDSILRLTDATGRQLALNDDHEDKGTGLLTHHADSLLASTLPADGTYYVHTGDTQHKGGSDYAYRLRISLPRPDFELRVAPSCISVPAGATMAFPVYALRRDEFAGEIALQLTGAPSGFRLSGARIPPGQDQVRLTLTAPLVPLSAPRSIRLEGLAMIAGREIMHSAVAADDMMQAFAYHHLVPAHDLKLWSTGHRTSTASVAVLGPSPVKIPAGGSARLEAVLAAGTSFDEVHLELDEPPAGISVQNVPSGRHRTEVVLTSDAAKVKPGLAGNLIVYAFGAKAAQPGKKEGAGNRPKTALGMLPAVPFEIVAASPPDRTPAKHEPPAAGRND